MNVDKAQIKVGAVHEVGVRLDDALEGARSEVHRADGASAALERAAEACSQITRLVDKELDEGKIPDIATAALVKKWVDRCVSAVREARAQSLVTKAQSQGKVSAMETAVGIAKKFVDDENRKIEAFRSAVASGSIKPEESGRPPPSIKQQRLDSGKTKKVKSNGKNTR